MGVAPGAVARMLPILVAVFIAAVPTAAAHDGDALGWRDDPVLGLVHDHPDPGYSSSLLLFPGHGEVMRRVDAVADHPWFTVHELGTSAEGRAIRLVEVINPESDVPVEDRVVTLLLTQQHGNEPAGTPAVLRLLEEIKAGGSIADALHNQVLLVVPLANPDGAEAARRENAAGVDTNRDHNHLETDETQAMHAVLSAWRVHVALDHHEYGGTGLGNPFPIRLYDYDLTTLYPTHAGTHPDVLLMAKNLMYDGIWPAAEAEGYTVSEYGVLTLHGIPLEQLAGGPDPGILRNHWGLHHIAGILIESRIDTHPNPFHDAARREHVQYVTMTSTLEYASTHAALFIAARANAEAAHTLAPPATYQESHGEAGAAIPPAYILRQGDPRGVLALHGLPVGVETAGGLVHNVDHAWPVHAAALMSGASSRGVLDGVATDSVPIVLAGDEELDERMPAPGVAIVLLALGALVAWRSRGPNRRP